MGLQARRLRGACAPRKVRTPQGRVLGNAQAGKPDGRAQQREHRRCGLWPQVRVKRCGKSAPAVPVTAPARQAPPGATPDRDDDAARRVPGRRQRARFGNEPPRWMAVHDRIRLTGLLTESPAPAGLSHAGAPLADDAVPEIPELEDRGADRGHPGRAAAAPAATVGGMETTALHTSPLAAELRAHGFVGRLVEPADAGYDEARAGWNGAIDRRPAAVAYAGDADDVAAGHPRRPRARPGVHDPRRRALGLGALRPRRRAVHRPAGAERRRGRSPPRRRARRRRRAAERARRRHAGARTCGAGAARSRTPASAA